MSLICFYSVEIRVYHEDFFKKRSVSKRVQVVVLATEELGPCAAITSFERLSDDTSDPRVDITRVCRFAAFA